MKLYFAGSGPNDILVKHNAFRLVTYADKNQVKNWWKVSNNKQAFLDSGAFTAFTQKKTININDYIRYIKDNKEKIEVYSVLDVIGDAEGTKHNQAYMESQGTTPLPVYHVGSPFEDLLALCKKYDYIALGGLVPHAMNKEFLRKWLDYCFHYTRDKIKCHGFGLNAEWAWKRYPFYSVDATSWLSGARYAHVEIDGQKSTKQSKTVMGMKLHTESYRVISEMALIDYVRKAEQITQLWKTRGIDWKD